MLRSALEEMSASDFLELTSDLSDDELSQLTEEAEDEADNTGVAIVDGKSRSKRGIILGTAIKKALGGALAGAILPGAKKKKAVKAKVLIGSQKKSGSSKKKGGSSGHSSSHAKSCSTIKKCWDKPVRKCKSTPIETCENIPVEDCHDVPQQKCWNEPETKCTSVPEEKCWTLDNQVCWEEPREHCTEQKMKVAKKWCLEEEDDSKKKLPFF